MEDPEIVSDVPTDETTLNKEKFLLLLQENSTRIKCVTNPSPHATSDVWNRFKIVHVDGKPVDFVKCNTCIVIQQWNSRMGTTTMSRHRCNIPEIKKMDCPPNQQKLTNMIPKVVSPQGIETLNDTVVTGLAFDLRPLASVEGRGFKMIGQALINFGAKYGPQKYENVVKGRTALAKTHLQKVSDQLKDKLRQSLKGSPNFPYFAFTFDLWTKVKRNRPFISLTCHYVDANFAMQSKLLSAKELDASEKKTTLNNRKTCEEIIKEYFPDDDSLLKIMEHSYAVTDGGSNVINVFDHRLPCFCHKINLIIDNSFSKGKLESVPEINRTIANSKALVKYFKKTGLNAQLPTSLKQEVPTRWNSLLTMLQSILKCFTEIQQLLLEKTQLDKVTGLQESLLGELCKLLEPFKNSTEAFSAEKNVTIDQVVPQYFVLLKTLETTGNDSEEIVILKRSMLELLSHYYEKPLSPIHYAATALNPKYRSLRMANDDQRNAAYQYLRQMLLKIEDSGYKNECIEVSPKKAKYSGPLNFLEDSSDEEDFENTTDKITEYINMKLNRAEKEQFGSDPLAYWSQNVKFPKLRLVSFRILAIPASQTSDEQTFSVTGQIISDRRTMLGGSTVSALTSINKIFDMK